MEPHHASVSVPLQVLLTIPAGEARVTMANASLLDTIPDEGQQRWRPIVGDHLTRLEGRTEVRT